MKFSIRVWSTVCRCPVSFDGYVIFLFGEHPEDLGAVIREEDRVKLGCQLAFGSCQKSSIWSTTPTMTFKPWPLISAAGVPLGASLHGW